MNEKVGRFLDDRHEKRHRTSFLDTLRTLCVKTTQVAIMEPLTSIGRVTLKIKNRKIVSHIEYKLRGIRGRFDGHIGIWDSSPQFHHTKFTTLTKPSYRNEVHGMYIYTSLGIPGTAYYWTYLNKEHELRINIFIIHLSVWYMVMNPIEFYVLCA